MEGKGESRKLEKDNNRMRMLDRMTDEYLTLLLVQEVGRI